MAHARGFQCHRDFTLARFADLDLLDGPRLVEIPDERTFGLHQSASDRVVSRCLSAATSIFPVPPRGIMSSESTISHTVGILNELNSFRADDRSRPTGPSPTTTAPTCPATSVTN